MGVDVAHEPPDILPLKGDPTPGLAPVSRNGPGPEQPYSGKSAVAQMPDSTPSDDLVAGISVPARITLFGFDAVDATARIEARTTGWRARRASMALAAGLFMAPLLAVVPPHAPWVVIAVVVGLLTARRRWAEAHTLHFLEGACPRCETGISLNRPARLGRPHLISCPSCQYELTVSVDL